MSNGQPAMLAGHPMERPSLTGRSALWTAIVVVLVAANLRPAIVAVSPLLNEIRTDEGLSATAAGLLTTIPVLCFGLFSIVVPSLSRRWGLEQVLLGAMLLLIGGFAVRLLPNVAALFVGTALVGIAIAIGNVLLPALIKRDFAGHTGLMTGLYSMALSGGAALAAGLTIPVARAAGLDWRPALAAWGLFAVVGAVASVTRVRRHTTTPVDERPSVPNLWGSKLAWFVTLFLGLQSFMYYSMTAWLPAYLISRGMSASEAGWMLSLVNLFGIVACLIVPMIAGRLTRQRALGLVITAAVFVSILGLLLGPLASATTWVVLFGLGQGASLSLSLLLIVLRASDAAHTSELSGMAQGVGYSLAAIGPFALGALHDATGSWTASFLLLAAVLVVQGVTAYGAGKNEHVRIRGV